MSKAITIVMYHYIRDLRASRYPEIKGLDLEFFRKQIEFFEANYTFIDYDQLLDACINGTTLPKNSVFLTFDDGYIDHYNNVFPILNEKGIQGFFSMPGKIIAEGKVLDVNKIHFILASQQIDQLMQKVRKRLDFYRGGEYSIPPYEELYEKLAIANRFDTKEVIFVKRLLQVELEESLRNLIVDDLFCDCVSLPEAAFASELYMSFDQIKLMKREGMCFGIHGYEHYWMNRLEQRELVDDIAKALDVFEKVLPSHGWGCCYPYGSIDERVRNTVADMGANIGFTTRVAFAKVSEDDCLALPRFDTNDFPPKSTNYASYQ